MYIQYALSKGHHEVKLKMIGQCQVCKVVTAKLYNSEGRRFEDIFSKTRKTYLDDSINWDEEATDAREVSHEEVIYKFHHQHEENADLLMLGAQAKVKDIKPVRVTLEKTQNFPRSLGESLQPRLKVVFNRSAPF